MEAVDVSGDGRRLIAQMADGTAQVWDVETGRPAGPPLRPADAELPTSIARRKSESKPAVALSADGRLALTTSDGAVNVWETETGLPIGPPLQAPAIIERVLLCDPSIVMAFTRNDSVQAWDLSSGPTPDRDLIRLAGLLSGRRVEPDGAVAPVPADDLTRAAWHDLHGRQSELLERPAEPELDWHRGKAQQFESAGDFFAAVVHLDPLVAAAPDDTELRGRRAEAEAKLGRFAAAAADFAVVVQRQPANAEATLSLAVLSARLGNHDAYRSACTTLVAPIRRYLPSPSAIATFHAATVRPAGLQDPEALVKLLEPAARFFAWDPGFCSARAFAQYRAGHFEAARQAACDSIAAYARGGAPGAFSRSSATEVTPERASGTPRDWFLMALVEARLGHGEAATAWCSKAVHWLDRATADRTDPEVLGGMSTRLGPDAVPEAAANFCDLRASLRPQHDQALPADLEATSRARAASGGD